MKKRIWLAILLVVALCGAAQVSAHVRNVQTFSTGYFQNGFRSIPAPPDSKYCALSTVTTTINVSATKYCTIDQQNGVFVLKAFADRNSGVNCSMTCFSSR